MITPERIAAIRSKPHGPDVAALMDRIAQLEAQVSSQYSALMHWRREADRDAGKIARLERYAQCLRVGAMWAYQLAGSTGSSVEALDNLSALANGDIPPHPWPYPAMAGGALEKRVSEWVVSRIGASHMNRRERAMRLAEEAIELAQAEGITADQIAKQAAHVYARPLGEPEQEAGGVAVCLLAWCFSAGELFADLALREIERIEAKPIDQIRGSLARKADADLVVCAESE